MKKRIAGIVCVLLAVVLTACGTFTDMELEVGTITVTSTSIDAEGRLLTVCSADKSNDPIGENQSPQLAWEPVEEAGCYIVVMFDEDANWLHWLTGELTDTALEQGAYTQHDVYVGPYPPGMAGRHNYRMEVFALRGTPDAVELKMDARGDYAALVRQLDTAGGTGGNILARGHVVGTYARGDDNR